MFLLRLKNPSYSDYVTLCSVLFYRPNDVIMPLHIQGHTFPSPSLSVADYFYLIREQKKQLPANDVIKWRGLFTSPKDTFVDNDSLSKQLLPCFQPCRAWKQLLYKDKKGKSYLPAHSLSLEHMTKTPEVRNMSLLVSVMLI